MTVLSETINLSYCYEPVHDREGEYKIIFSDRTKGTYQLMDLEDLAGVVGKNNEELISSFVFEHDTDWTYPSDFHPGECLGYEGGREQFSILDGDYEERIKRIESRISRYISSHLSLIGKYDLELIIAFVISTYFMPMFDYAPRLIIRGDTNSGKSTLLKILAELCYRGNLTGDTTEASLFRYISSTSMTPLLDEFQDYPREAQNGIKKVLKNGNSRGCSVQRTEKSVKGEFKPVSYDIFGPMALILQSGRNSIPEEVTNRSITITMFSLSDKIIPMEPDRCELREIRDELYTVRSMWIAEPDRIRFEDFRKEILEQLQSREGIVAGGMTYRFTNRCRDIMGTMLTVAKMAGLEDAIIKAFAEMQDVLIDDERDSDLGRVFASILKCAEDYMEENPINGGIYDALTNISTTSIAQIYRDKQKEEDELGEYERLSTRTVTNMIKDMGFKLQRDRATNKSVLSYCGLESSFQFNLTKYGTEKAFEKYGSDRIKTLLSQQGRGGFEMNSEQLNYLTRKQGV